MSPPSDHPCLNLHLLPAEFFVARFSPEEGVPKHLLERLGQKSSKFLSITTAQNEISIVGEADQGLDFESVWRCIKIAGPMEFGVVASFTAPLKNAGCPVFAVSTYDTDYILVPKEKVETAVEALKKDGWVFARS